MPSSKRSIRYVTRLTLLGLIAAVALSITVVGVGAKPASFIQSLQGYFNVTPNDGALDQAPTFRTSSTEMPVACTNGAVDLGSPNSPSATCPLTVLPNDGSTSGNARAPATRFAASRSVYLITASELAAAGYANGQVPTTIGWDYQTAPGVSGSAPLKIYFQNTTDTTYTKGTSFAAAIGPMTKVHDATTTLPGAVGPFDITLTGGTPFTYTGGGLYVAYDWGPYSGTLSTTSVIYTNTTLTNGLAGANSATDTLGLSNFRPETRLSSSVQNDAGVTAIYSYGELPKGKVGPQTIKAVITNNGANAITNLAVTLNITGSDSFTDTQIVPSLGSCGATTVVTFAPFTPGLGGNDTIQVSVPADDVSTNNTKTQPLNITAGRYTYKIPGSVSSGGVGLTGGTGAFVAKFNTSVAAKITDVKLEFSATGGTYKVAIYGDNGGVPSTTPIYVDASNRTVTAVGPVTVTLPAPVTVGPGNFYVGVQQVSTTNVSLGFDGENPIRSGSFFFGTSLPVTIWNDEAPGNNFKLNIGIQLQSNKARPDFDADGKADISVFRPSDGNWYENNSNTGFTATHWGQNGDVPVPGDYDGDGKTDAAVWRPSDTPGVADFYVLNSSDGTINGFSLGITTDIPVAGDYDGDGKSDFAVFRPSAGYWFIYNSSTQSTSTIQFGATGDLPFTMDNDGDGKSNLAVFRPSNNTWYIALPTGTPAQAFTAVTFGTAGDVIVPADYDGDTRDDIAVFRPSNGTWYILRSSDGGFTATQFGASGDVPVPADYDGDGRADVAVYRSGVWYINGSTSGFAAVNFGLASDIPIPSKYHP